MFGTPLAHQYSNKQEMNGVRCSKVLDLNGAEGGNRTRTPLRAQDFKSDEAVWICFQYFVRVRSGLDNLAI